MNLRDLHYLVAIADHQHFGKAAEHCFVSQPALSMQIKKLEEFLGVTLIERTNKKVLITPIGNEIIARARTIIAEADAIKTMARYHQDPLAGELRLGAFPTLAPYFLPTIIPTLTTQFPNLQLLLAEEKTDTLLAQLEQGKLDAALLALPIESSQLTATPLFNDPFFIALSPQHPLANETALTHQQLQNESLLLLEEGHCLRDQALDVCRIIGSNKQQDFRATSLETLRQMVYANNGITIIPQTAKKENDGLVYLPFADNIPYRTIGLVWRKTSPRGKCCEAIAETLEATTAIA